MRQLTFDPYVPLALWTALTATAAVLLAWYALASRDRVPAGRRAAVFALMTLVVTLPLAILLNPTWLERIPPPAGTPRLTVLVDGSASMGVADPRGGALRYRAACQMAADTVARLGERYEVRLWRFGTGTVPITQEQLRTREPREPSTDIARALEDVLAEESPAGQAILLLSDGVHNGGGGTARVLEAATKAKAMAAPVYCRTIGGPGDVRDLAVELHAAQELAFVGQKVPTVVSVRQRGRSAASAELSLTADGKPLERRTVKLVPDGVAEAVFTLPAQKAGLYRYELQVQGTAQEVTTLNNRATLVVRVLDQPIRVLLLEGKPYWDTKFLVRALASDPSVELVSVMQMAPGRLLQRKIVRGSDQTDAWAIQQDAGQLLGRAGAMDRYQVLILGRGGEAFLSERAVVRLKRWLSESEGSLVCFRGPPAAAITERLNQLLPVRWTPSRETRFRMEWSALGQTLRWFPADAGGQEDVKLLPALVRSSRAERPSPLAVVLATAGASGAEAGEPVMCYQPVGTGRVVVLEGAGMWRWSFLPPPFRQHDDTYGLFWRSMMRWLVANIGLLPDQKLALRTDKVTFLAHESVTATLLVRPQALAGKTPQIELAGPGDSDRRRVNPEPVGNDPGQFRVNFGRLSEGRYTARVVGVETDRVASTAVFDVRGDLAERLEVAAQPELLRLVAQRSGGAVLDGEDPAQLAARFDRHLSQTRPERLMRTMAWDRWWLLVAVLGAWAVAWGFRRSQGLV
jgi:hypothetical protein